MVNIDAITAEACNFCTLYKVTRDWHGPQISTESLCCCREDAHAALQLYLLHIKNDPDLMTLEELVEFELSSMQLKAAPDAD